MHQPPDLITKNIESRQGQILSAVPLNGGRTNQLWRIQTTNIDLVLKRFHRNKATPLFPNDPHDEKQALVHLNALSLAPKLFDHWVLEGDHYIAYEFVNGVYLQQTTARLIQSLSLLHAQTPHDSFRSVSLDTAELLSLGDFFLAHAEPNLRKELKAKRPPSLGKVSSETRQLHGDPIPCNAICDDDNLVFIDWQCPAIGDPTHDLAIALSPAMHIAYGFTAPSTAQRNSLLAYYPDKSVRERFDLLQPFFSWRLACYCAMRAAQNDPAYSEAAIAELNLIRSL